MEYKFGKLPHIPGAVTWKYRDIFNPAKLTKPPMTFGHVWNDTPIPMLGNDKAGNCVWCTQAHLLQSMQRGVGMPETEFSAESVNSDYTALTGYRPDNPVTDVGTHMAKAAAYWRHQGIRDAAGNAHKIVSYVELKTDDVEALVQATFDFGGIALGVQFSDSAQRQWVQKQPWVHWGRKSKILGGHAVALVGRNSRGNGIIATWDGIIAASPQWIAEYADEALAFFSLEYLDAKNINPRGYDRTELERKIAALGGGSDA